jgi:hypothetical protein
VVKGHASLKLRGVHGTCARVLGIQVFGTQITSVKFFLDGRRITGRTVTRGKHYAAVIMLSAGTHRVTAKVTFKASSKTHPKALHETVTGCKPARPLFTG